MQLHGKDVDNIHFYDDDPENARKVAQICQGDGAEGMEGTELEIYNYEFAKGVDASKPTFSCTIGENKTIKLTRKDLRQVIAEVLGFDDAL